MVRTGKVMSIDRKDRTGVIRDAKGRDFFFAEAECKDGNLPPVYSQVTFIKDEDFKSTPVACLVQVDQLPRAI